MVAWWCKILSSAKDISLDLILQFDHIQFHVTSQSHPSKYYIIDLHQPMCDCADFLRIWFCKHIAAVYRHFPHLSPKGINLSLLTEDITLPSQSEHTPSQEDNLQSLIQDITALFHTLVSKLLFLAILKATCSAKHMLMVAIMGSNTLPEKDVIAPNQKSWMEMAKWMGVKCSTPKWKCLPKEYRMTAQSISIAKGKHHLVHSDPYAGGE